MSFQKSLFMKMIFVLGLILMVTAFAPHDSSANMVDECFGKDRSEDCSSEIDNADEETSPSASSNIGVFDYIKVLFALLVVIGILVFILKFVNRKSAAYQQNSLMKNIGGLSLGNQKSAQVLQIGNRLYIVGVGENISLLKGIEHEDEIEQILSYFENKQQDFSTKPFIMQQVEKLRQRNSKPTESPQATSFNELFGSKLKELKKDRSNELNSWKEKEKNDHE